MKKVQPIIVALLLGGCFLVENANACPAPQGDTEPYGFTKFRGGWSGWIHSSYYIFFCQLPKPETQSYTLTAANIGNVDQIGTTVMGKAFADTTNHSGQYPIGSTPASINGSLDLSGLTLNGDSVSLESNSFNFYSRRTSGNCVGKRWETRKSEYEYIVGYLKGISVNGSPSAPPSTGDIFSAVNPNGNSFQAVPVGNNTNATAGQIVARIANVKLGHTASGGEITGNIDFVIRDIKQYRLRGGQRVCRVGITTRLVINPASGFVPTISSSGTYQIHVHVNKP